LKEYVKYHFLAEEELMAKVAYPGLEAQKAAHQKFLLTVTSMEKRWQAGDKTVISEMMNVLQVWLVDHIMKMDKKYASYVN
jgi:hemerythrin